MIDQQLDVTRLEVETWTWIRSHPILNGITDEDVKRILPYFKYVVVQANEYLFEEGPEISLELYLVLHGTFEVIKSIEVTDSRTELAGIDKHFTIARLTAGDTIGELSFIKGAPRSASIRTTSTSSLLSLHPDQLKNMEYDYPVVSGNIMKNLLGYVGDRLKKTTKNEVNALKVELQNSVLNSKANLFFSYIIGLLCVYNLAINTITNLSMDVDSASLISAAIIIIFCGVLVLMIRQSKLPIRIFGLTTQNWKPAVKESVLWSVFIVAVLVAIKWMLIRYVPRYHDLSLIDFHPTQQKHLAFNFILYGLHSPVQEFIARGVLQGSLQHFFTGKNVTLRAIIISNALFSATHVHLMSGMLGVIVFVPGLFWGWLYSRHENLIGISISHLMIGWSALFFLNIESLF